MPAIEELITNQLDVWSAAVKRKATAGRGSSGKFEPYGIKKLREMILELAVRGLLVPQDPKDENASELLKNIAAAKAKLIKEGKISRDKQLPPVDDDEKPFAVPAGWQWSRLQDVSEYIQRGKGPVYAETGRVRVVSQKCIQWRGFDIAAARFVDDASIGGYKGERFLKGRDLLWNSTGTGTVGRANVLEQVEERALVADSHVTVVRTLNVDAKFFCIYIWSPGVQCRMEPAHEASLVSGSTQQVELNTSSVVILPVPVPPLDEQHRIVARVDELMALCDRLEQQADSSRSVHQTLVENLLNALTSVADHAQLASSWKYIAAHFDTLFTTEEGIDQLKQAILQLAVMGKLVPQDPNDEPASELMKKISLEKARLVKEGKIKKERPLPLAGNGKEPFELPLGWVWARFPELGEFGRGKSKHRPRNDPALFNPGLHPLVQTGEVARAEDVICEYHSKYSDVGLAQSKLWPAGTLCITIAANIADSAILGFDACFPDSVVGFVPHAPLADAKYFLTFMKTARAELLRFAPSTAQKNINLEILESVLIPVPPLGEMVRIADAIAELTALCDQLRSRLGVAQATQVHLADAMADQVIAEA